MKCITVCAQVRKLAGAAIVGTLFCLVGCETGPSKEATAPPANTEGLAKTSDTTAPVTATGEDYNALMRKQQEENQKRGSVYPPKK